MTAATADRRSTYRERSFFAYPVLANAVIFKGTMVALDTSGWAKPASASATLKVVGVAVDGKDATDLANGAIVVEVDRRGAYLFENSGGGDAISADDIGQFCYAVDDQTVALTSSSGIRPVAGMIEDVQSGGVWVNFSSHLDRKVEALEGEDSENDTAITALQARIVPVTMEVEDLAGAIGGTQYLVAPIAGTITRIQSIIDGALTVGNEVLTPSINGVAITTTPITITQAGSAAGDVDSTVPTAANTVAVGDKISVAFTGTNTATVKGRVVVSILPS
jgi:hypothetical protein